MPYNNNEPKNNARNKNKSKKELVYGINTITALINTHPNRILTIFCEKKLNNTEYLIKSKNPKIVNILNTANRFGISVQEINSKVIDQWLNDDCYSKSKHKISHQGIVAYVTPTKFLVVEDLINIIKDNNRNDKKSIFLVLDNIQDPGNLGACIRSASAFGVDAVIISRNGTCDITPVVKKAACGAVDLVPIAKVGNLNSCLLTLKEQGIWVVSLAATHSENLSMLDLKIPIALVLGSENFGVRNIIKKHSDFLARIPMNNDLLDSLNLSVATGICLYEVNKQRNNEYNKQ